MERRDEEVLKLPGMSYFSTISLRGKLRTLILQSGTQSRTQKVQDPYCEPYRHTLTHCFLHHSCDFTTYCSKLAAICILGAATFSFLIPAEFLQHIFHQCDKHQPVQLAFSQHRQSHWTNFLIKKQLSILTVNYNEKWPRFQSENYIAPKAQEE